MRLKIKVEASVRENMQKGKRKLRYLMEEICKYMHHARNRVRKVFDRCQKVGE